LIFYIIGFASAFHLYVYLKLRVAFGPGRWSLFFFGVFAFFASAQLARYFGILGDGRFFEVVFALAITEYVIVGMLCAVLVLTEILKIVLCLWDKAKKTRSELFVTPRRAAVFSLVFVFCIVVYGYNEAWNVKEVHLVIPSAKLPENVKRLRVVQISDVHIGGVYPTRHLERVMSMVRAVEPDIFVVTGDLFDGDMSYRSREAGLISTNGAKYGAFAIFGNHEYYALFDQAFMEQCGLTLLCDQMTEIAGIAIVGLDDFSMTWPSNLKTLQDSFVLLLKHRPHVLESSQGKFDLQLSGHTHGGQLWPLGLLPQKVQGYVQGLSKDGESFVYVSNGTGYWAAPLRLFTPPEVTVIDLIHSSQL
jgi:predicted MPP superfamily phosphohydrolase